MKDHRATLADCLVGLLLGRARGQYLNHDHTLSHKTVAERDGIVEDL